MQKAVRATASLSNPPATDLMMCAGMMLITAADTRPTVLLSDSSAESRKTKKVAEAPNHAGTKQQTSFKLIGPNAKNFPLFGR